jgi:hypothetical protein
VILYLKGGLLTPWAQATLARGTVHWQYLQGQNSQGSEAAAELLQRFGLGDRKAIMMSSRGALCALVVLGSLLVFTNAWGPFDSRNPVKAAPLPLATVEEAPVGSLLLTP